MTTADRLFPMAAKDDDPVVREQVARLNRGLFQMLRVISNMSDANRFSADTDARQEVRDVRGIFSEIIAKAAALAEHSGIRVEAQIHPESVYSLVDAEKLERAVYNIVSNALKFTPEGGLLQVSLTRRGDKLYFSVRDEGPGIAENLRSGIFSRYTREPGLEDGRFGIGLGLVLIRSAASLHDGTVLVDHPQGKGTRITMSMTIRSGSATAFRSPMMKVDYAGEWDHGLLELSDTLPASLYDPKK
jgi:signal transduction histidine kinase